MKKSFTHCPPLPLCRRHLLRNLLEAGNFRRLLRCGALLSWLVLAGCAQSPSKPITYEATPPLFISPPEPAPGAIYRPGAELLLFQDQKARNPGDLITVLLVESTNASVTARTKTSKNSKNDLADPVLLGGAVTLGGRGILQNSLSGAREFEGSGDSTQSNKLQGSLTVTVAERLANGNLIVRGQKLLHLNQGDEYVQIQGIVRGADIAPDNTVPSNRIADARITYSGKGTIAKSNIMGWLARFFQSPAFPL